MDVEPLEDKLLICVDCNEEFVFTVAAQAYFRERGITEEPKRCKACYLLIKKEKRSQERKLPRVRPWDWERWRFGSVWLWGLSRSLEWSRFLNRGPLEDRYLYCVDCGRAFVFTVADQRRILEGDLSAEPKRCGACKLKYIRTRRRF